MGGFNRRDFLRASALAFGSIVVSSGLQGCLSSSSSSDDETVRGLAFEQVGAPAMLKLTSRGILLAAQLDTGAPKKRTPATSDSVWITGGATGPGKEVRS